MNIFAILSHVYTNKHSQWIDLLDDDDINSTVVYTLSRFFICNDEIRIQARFLDKYTYNIPPKMWLSLAWSIIPKYNKAPFVKYIKSLDDEDEWGFILNKIRRYYEMSDNDFKHTRMFLINNIKKDMYSYFCAWGIEKSYWKKYGLDYSKIKEYGEKRIVPQQGLNAWGI
jgi:hypothetical protein